MENLKKIGRKKEQNENSENSESRVQFYWLL